MNTAEVLGELSEWNLTVIERENTLWAAMKYGEAAVPVDDGYLSVYYRDGGYEIVPSASIVREEKSNLIGVTNHSRRDYHQETRPRENQVPRGRRAASPEPAGTDAPEVLVLKDFREWLRARGLAKNGVLDQIANEAALALLDEYVAALPVLPEPEDAPEPVAPAAPARGRRRTTPVSGYVSHETGDVIHEYGDEHEEDPIGEITPKRRGRPAKAAEPAPASAPARRRSVAAVPDPEPEDDAPGDDEPDDEPAPPRRGRPRRAPESVPAANVRANRQLSGSHGPARRGQQREEAPY